LVLRKKNSHTTDPKRSNDLPHSHQLCTEVLADFDNGFLNGQDERVELTAEQNRALQLIAYYDRMGGRVCPIDHLMDFIWSKCKRSLPKKPQHAVQIIIYDIRRKLKQVHSHDLDLIRSSRKKSGYYLIPCALCKRDQRSETYLPDKPPAH